MTEIIGNRQVAARKMICVSTFDGDNSNTFLYDSNQP